MISLNLGISGNKDDQEKPAIMAGVSAVADARTTFDGNAYFARLEAVNAATAHSRSMHDPILASLVRHI